MSKNVKWKVTEENTVNVNKPLASTGTYKYKCKHRNARRHIHLILKKKIAYIFKVCYV